MIIMNPSKNFREVYTQSLIESLPRENENENNSNIFKRFILYAGSKIFMNSKPDFDTIKKQIILINLTINIIQLINVKKYKFNITLKILYIIIIKLN